MDDTVDFAWAEAGTYTVTATLQNRGGQLKASYPIQIVESYEIYLPLVLR